ncbi:hypothetical protein [Streptomyces sp. ALI-76-A]|uniref:hypothetical protein n=1 Tax=Streptomyces sp. ALI-76-A TaxID=3025736 RepID=UPI00256F0DB2|nr:hypothetical protein [Streptomyces sp. ALI-76-A]MDL5205959.1 hypothetical protein [Streptomyces sp. ALI-76-A]
MSPDHMAVVLTVVPSAVPLGSAAGRLTRRRPVVTSTHAVGAPDAWFPGWPWWRPPAPSRARPRGTGSTPSAA